MWRAHLTKGNFFLGLGSGILVHEVVLVQHERPFVLAAALALCGLKWTIPSDTSRKED